MAKDWNSSVNMDRFRRSSGLYPRILITSISSEVSPGVGDHSCDSGPWPRRFFSSMIYVSGESIVRGELSEKVWRKKKRVQLELNREAQGQCSKQPSLSYLDEGVRSAAISKESPTHQQSFPSVDNPPMVASELKLTIAKAV